MSRIIDFKHAGLGYVLTYPDLDTSFHVDRLKVSSGEMRGDVMVKTLRPEARTFAGNLLHYSRENLSSQTARKSLGKNLEEKVPTKPPLDWAGMYDEFCTMVMLADREGLPVDLVGNMPPRTLPRLLLDPMLPLGNGSILFGDGGLGKSIMALAIAISVQTGKTIIPGFTPTSPGPVLVLNWETTKEDIDDRMKAICTGAGIAPPDMVHIHGRGRPLAHQVESVARRVDETGAVLLVIDSANKAIGTSGEGPIEDAVNRFTSALDEIGRSSLCIDHVAKYTSDSANGAGKPIGSTTKSNWARATWELRRSGKANGVSHLTMFNRKSNDTDQLEPIGLAMKWAGRSVSWSVDDPMYEMFEEKRESDADRIAEVLGDHPYRAKEIAHLLGKTETVIRVTMNRHKDRFTHLETGDWALVGHP